MHWWRTALLGAGALGASSAWAQPVYDVTVTERRPVTSGSTYVIEGDDFSLLGLDTMERVIETIPPLMAAQHAGGGKANQYLVRGFDADHGTDFAFFLDMLPVNMRTHAHGQGFTDLNFVIPETIQRIEVSMGPYSAEFGDFATAGAANLQIYEVAPEPFLMADGGQWESVRTVGMWSPQSGPLAGGEAPGSLLVAGEFNTTDGPFEDGENLLQYKGFVRAGWEFSERTRVEGWLSVYDGDWHGSGQIAERFVRRPGFNRWDSVDPSEGGDSDRESALVRLVHQPAPNRRLEATAWVAHYALDLYSNFTYFLSDFEDGLDCAPGNPFSNCDGDGIVQSDDRIYTGGSLVYRHELELWRPMVLSAGLDTRSDFPHVQLQNQKQRDRLAPVADDDVVVSSLAGFVTADVLLADWVRAVPALRLEGFRFDVDNRCRDCTLDPGNPESGLRGEGTEYDGVALPKASLILSPFAPEAPLPLATPELRDAQLFLNWGIGYHSNDARDVVANPSETTLPTAMGWEVGWRMPIAEWGELSVAAWWLDLENEFVFVGDEGTTEIRPRSHRDGIELAARAQPWEWLEGELSFAYSRARYAADDPDLGIDDGDPVAQAPGIVAKARVRGTVRGLSAEVDFRALGERHALDTRQSPHLSDYAVFDLGMRYRRGPLEASVLVENVFDTQWRSAEFFFESFDPTFDVEPQEDFHFVPGNPRNIRVGLTWYLP
jgi:outer membrane receptor protein involved in Fe transport